jgi:hypothetical protein
MRLPRVPLDDHTGGSVCHQIEHEETQEETRMRDAGERVMTEIIENTRLLAPTCIHRGLNTGLAERPG